MSPVRIRSPTLFSSGRIDPQSLANPVFSAVKSAAFRGRKKWINDASQASALRFGQKPNDLLGVHGLHQMVIEARRFPSTQAGGPSSHGPVQSVISRRILEYPVWAPQGLGAQLFAVNEPAIA
jgi:hypothetical protein